MQAVESPKAISSKESPYSRQVAFKALLGIDAVTAIYLGFTV